MAITKKPRRSTVKFPKEYFIDYLPRTTQPIYGAFPGTGGFALLRATNVVREENDTDEIIVERLKKWMYTHSVSVVYDVFEEINPDTGVHRFHMKCFSAF